jgi:PHD/YefM family antitoxin component YafN of YafNO toxin-antitoxin module
MRVTATKARNRFGAFCTQAKTEPVFVEKDGRIDTVILSADPFDALRTCQACAPGP